MGDTDVTIKLGAETADVGVDTVEVTDVRGVGITGKGSELVGMLEGVTGVGKKELVGIKEK